MAASSLLRSARLARGLSQSQLAARANTSQPDISTIENGKRTPTVDTLERLLHQTGHRIIAIPSVGIDAGDTAIRISAASDADSRDRALRAFLDYSDSLRAAEWLDRVMLGYAEPPPTRSRSWDAALAGLVEFWFNDASLPMPRWIERSTRFLDAPESPQLTKYDLPPNLANVPPEFLRRNVMIERATLESV